MPTANTSLTFTLSPGSTTYYVVTATLNDVESVTSRAIAATAHPQTFLTIAGGGTDTVWMDRNLGAAQVATSSTGYPCLRQFVSMGTSS